MKRRSSGQSIVEMAFVLPVLLIVLFGVMEFGYIIFAYSTVSQAARNAAEVAAQLPPYQTWLAYKNQTGLANYPGYRADTCVNAVYSAAETDATVFSDITSSLDITYPYDATLGDTRNLDDRGPIQVTISYRVTGITPLFRMLRIGDSSGAITILVTQRRSLEGLGVDPSKPGGVACAKNIANWHVLNP
ncbi:MAG: TadE family protein [Chloroflexales bacterium]